MEQLSNKQPTITKLFLTTGLLLLGIGMIFGLAGALQYILPGFQKHFLSFEKIRPLHVSSMVFWIILGATGSVLTYLQQYAGRNIYSPFLMKIQLIIFIGAIIAILISYSIGIFGGREYWEFHPLLALPIIASWILMSINFFKSIVTFKKRPVYVWMWATGVIFFLFTFIESYLWIFPYFSNSIVNDMTVQWKSYGSMVGSWNMLIYGSSIFLIEKISGDKTYSRSFIAFLLYFTGLFNLMFNWGHHIYTLPTHDYIKHISYIVSMTELFIFGRILLKWKSSVTTAEKHIHHIAYRLLVAADVWVFFTLALAIAMSIPAVNIYTHGTHITVAHTMGATIGINCFLLLGIAFDVLFDSSRHFEVHKKLFNKAFWLANIALLIFWLSLISAGVIKAKWQMSSERAPFNIMMLQLQPFFIVFFVSGLLLTAGIMMIIYPLLKTQFSYYFNENLGK
ncbi:MAG: cbb3-type cytochrome c oxidase subunit I [Bacteroidetes bacterium]|nr:cbb3-type cytochrome c oxidase subunit I [Bacteroidota bacterium]